MRITERKFGSLIITTDTSKMDISAIHEYLSQYSGWSTGIPIDKVKKSMDNSLNFAVLEGDRQIGFARVISDFSTIAYLGDVYILEQYRGKGLARKLMDIIVTHPELQGLRRWILLTSTADWLYTKYGFTRVQHPENYMERFDAAIYKNSINAVPIE